MLGHPAEAVTQQWPFLMENTKGEMENSERVGDAKEERERWDPETLASGLHRTWNTENLLRLTFPVSGNWGKQWFPGLQELTMWKMAREDFPKHYADNTKIFWILLRLWLNIITNMKKVFSYTKCLWLLVIDQQFYIKASSNMTCFNGKYGVWVIW